MISFKQFLLEYTDWTKEYTARHQKPNGLFSGFVNKPRKTFDLVAQYRKNKTYVLPAIQKLKETKGQHICNPSDIEYIKKTYPQIDLGSLNNQGKSLGKTGIMIKKIMNPVTNQLQFVIYN